MSKMPEKIQKFLEPFKDVPEKLKTFPKSLIILLSRLNNSEDVEGRKKDAIVWLYFLVPVALLFMMLSNLFEDIAVISIIMKIPAIICYIGIVISLYAYIVAKKHGKKFADLECGNCKTRIPYSSDVKIDVIDTTYTVSKSKQSRDGGGVDVTVTGTERVYVRINCKCPKCSTPKSFEMKITTIVCERKERGVAAINADLIAANFERDVREEKKNDFDGSTGATIRGSKNIEAAVIKYFSDDSDALKVM